MQPVNRGRDYDALFQQFWPLYKERPIEINSWGCELPHLFGLWTFLRETKPTHVVESGVCKGQSTWLITETLPGARILSLDPFPERRVYTSPRAAYSSIDFGFQDLREFPAASTLVFFDDHVNAYLRLLQAKAWGFRHVVFDDNYPAGVGDPSIKQMLSAAPAGEHARLRDRIRERLKRLVAPGEMMVATAYSPVEAGAVLQNMADYDYEEIPPLFVPPKTRWGTDWSSTFGNIQPCLDIARLTDEQANEVRRTAMAYTSLCRLQRIKVEPLVAGGDEASEASNKAPASAHAQGDA